MPARLVLKRCLCDVCAEKGGTDVDGKPKGMLMEAHAIPAHLKRLQDEQAPDHMSNDRAHLSSTNPPTADSITGHLFALTLTDDGPNTNSIPNKLWSSRAEFQDTGPSNAAIADPLCQSSVPIADLGGSLSRLTLRSTKSSAPSAPSPSLTDPSPSNLAIPALVVGGRRLCKKDRHRCTVKALRLLNNIETCIHHCNRLFLEPSSSNFEKMQHEVLTLRLALEKVTWNADSVNSKKEILVALLNDLELQMKPHLSASQGPVDIDTGM